MNGAESLIRTALAAGVKVCFANPGTTKCPAGFVRCGSEMRAVWDSSRVFVRGPPMVTPDGRQAALHSFTLGVGLGNGVANLHNARRARSPIVNIIGDHATCHLKPMAAHFRYCLAGPTRIELGSHFAHGERLAEDFADAIAAASGQPGQVASLIVPANCQEDESPVPAAAAYGNQSRQ